LEKNDSFGGAVGTFQRGSLTIEGSLHEIDGFDEEDPKLPIVQALGLTEAVDFVEVGDLYEVRTPMLGEPLAMPAEIDAAAATVIHRFPNHERGVRAYCRRILAVRKAVSLGYRKQDERLWWMVNAPHLPRWFWPLLRDMRYSLGDVMHQHFGGDEAIKFALAGNLQYYADDTRRLWFPLYAAAQASYHLGGGHYVGGGSSRLAEHLISLIRDAGGEAHTGRRVTGILVADGRVAGVEHEAKDWVGTGGDVTRELAPVIFGNAAPHVLAEMLPEEHRQRFMTPYKDRPLSLSLWTLALGFDRKPSEFGVSSYSTWMFPDWMKSLDDLSQNGPLLGAPPSGRMPAFVFADYSFIDSGLPGPPYLGSVGGLDLIENWEGLSAEEERERRDRWSDVIVERLDREFPGIAGAVVERMLFTARNNRDYLNTPRGAVYGFAPQPPRRQFFKPRTPIKGLWLASAYGGFGGYTGVILSGAAAARAARKSAMHPSTSS
jgi:phytoene dehydrogenase-like protein